MLICKHCGIEFDHTAKHHREFGLINECSECAQEVVEKYVGRRDGGKHGTTEIFRENLATVKAVIKAECSGGFYPKIAISNAAFENAKDNFANR